MPKTAESLLLKLQKQAEKARRDLATLQAKIREEVKGVREKRRYAVGTLVEEAGLAEWDDAMLLELFRLLATLHDAPTAVGVLEGWLAEPARSTPTAPGPAQAVPHALD